jgi:hypothetical protein
LITALHHLLSLDLAQLLDKALPSSFLQNTAPDVSRILPPPNISSDERLPEL